MRLTDASAVRPEAPCFEHSLEGRLVTLIPPPHRPLPCQSCWHSHVAPQASCQSSYLSTACALGRVYLGTTEGCSGGMDISCAAVPGRMYSIPVPLFLGGGPVPGGHTQGPQKYSAPVRRTWLETASLHLRRSQASFEFQTTQSEIITAKKASTMMDPAADERDQEPWPWPWRLYPQRQRHGNMGNHNGRRANEETIRRACGHQLMASY